MRQVRERRGQSREQQRQALSPPRLCREQLWGAEPEGKQEGSAPSSLHKALSGSAVPRAGPSLRNAPSRGTWIWESIQPQLSQHSKFNPVVEKIVSAMTRFDL